MSRRDSQQGRLARKRVLADESARLRGQFGAELQATWQPIQIVAMAWRVLQLPPVWMLAWRTLRRLLRKRRGSRA